MPSEPLPLVTISAPYGAGGSVVGPKLAERIGVPFVDRAIPVSVSRRLDVPLDDAITHEQLPRDTLSRWATYFAPAVQLFGGAAVHEQVVLDDEAFRIATEEALHEHAQDGAVILGRAGAIVLRDAPGALHVRLSAPPERRIQQAMGLSGVDRETAERELRSSDVAREAYVKVWYHVDPADAAHYHLVIDSTRIALDCCVELIVLALTSGRGSTPPRGQSAPAT